MESSKNPSRLPALGSLVALLLSAVVITGCPGGSPPPTTCADFSGVAIGTAYPAAHQLLVNGVRFGLFYSGGGTISERSAYPGERFLEMREDGGLSIDAPFKAKQIDLHIIQAGNDPIGVRYFDNGGANLVGSATTTQKDVLEHLQFTGKDLTTAALTKPELLVHKVCFTPQ